MKLSTVRLMQFLPLSNDHYHISINPLNAELNAICHLVALLGVHHILHVSRITVNTVWSQTLKVKT